VLDKPVPSYVFPAGAVLLGMVSGGVPLATISIVAGTIFSKVFIGEFDPGSGRTLAACLTHASRAERPFGVLERRTGE
jgi:hypothetical protein